MHLHTWDLKKWQLCPHIRRCQINQAYIEKNELIKRALLTPCIEPVAQDVEYPASQNFLPRGTWACIGAEKLAAFF